MNRRADPLADIQAVAATEDWPGMCVVSGEIDISNADLLRAVIAELYEQSPRVVVDLSGVRFLASAGIAVLLDAVLDRDDRTMTIVEARAIETILRICGVAGVVSCHPDRESAVRACLTDTGKCGAPGGVGPPTHRVPPGGRRHASR